MIKHILFDLDGCLTDSYEGISKCVIYALGKFGIETSDRDFIRLFVGPPLVYAFQEYADLSEDDAYKATAYYRERYQDKGLFENRVYEGVYEMLESLKNDGFKISLCTSKPQPYAEKILAHFELDKYFDHIFGATFDTSISKKVDVITHVLKNIEESGDEVIMVGDTAHDVNGAHENDIKCIGVTYGYGATEELKKANADFLADSPKEIYTIMKKNS